MSHRSPLLLVFAAVAVLGLTVADASAQHRGGIVVGRAAPRVVGPRVVVAPRVIVPRVVGVVPYRPYYYPYRPGLTVGFYAGYGYPYGYYPYPYGYYNAYDYPLPPAGYVSAAPGVAYGGVRIQGAPRSAQVFADGYYVGIVDDFDGVFQHLNLQAGAHRIEIRGAGLPPIAFEVNVLPGRTITYHAAIR